jgi:Protein of unknown function (DUF4231)
MTLVKRLPTEIKPTRGTICCCTRYKDKSNFKTVLQELDLTNVEKQIIQLRYLNIVENFQKRARNYSFVFFSGHFIITVGSLFVPALLSIQNSDKNYTATGSNFAVEIYWATFVISILVTIFNGILTLFKVDKKYYFLNTTLERLRSEGWQYFSLTGRYSGHLINHQKPTHKNQFVFFTHYIEKIKMKQVEEEYYKAEEKASQTPTGNHVSTNHNQNGNTQDLYPPSPDQPLSSLGGTPEPVKEAIDSIIKSHKTIENLDKEQNVIVIPKPDDDMTVVDVDKI